jgi:hypothetical protein
MPIYTPGVYFIHHIMTCYYPSFWYSICHKFGLKVQTPLAGFASLIFWQVPSPSSLSLLSNFLIQDLEDVDFSPGHPVCFQWKMIFRNQDLKVRAHRGGVRIGKTPKKLDSICCCQCRETNADTLKWQRPIGEGDQELDKRLVQEELI